MANIEFDTVIKAPPERVFARVADLQNHVAWSGDAAIRKTSNGPVAVGTMYESDEARPLGRKASERSAVTHYEANERFGWRTYGPVGTWLDWSFELRHEGDGTRLTQRLVPKPGLLTAIAMKLLIERPMRRSMPQSLARIKELCEGDQAG